MKTHQKIGLALVISGILLSFIGHSITILALISVASVLIGLVLLTPLINYL